MRTYPALDLVWAVHPDDDVVDRLLAELDVEQPTAVEERPGALRIHFESHVARGRAAVRALAFDPALSCEPIDVPGDDWAEKNQTDLPPVRVGRIVVQSSPCPAGGPDLCLHIPASMGFGTGHHASTRLCLELLQRSPIAGSRVLDAGTGSGILAIAAWRLGAERVIALDHDDDAVAAARSNLALNAAAPAVSLIAADLHRNLPAEARGPFDLILANLTSTAIVHLAGRFAELSPAGTLIASGFLAADDDRVVAALRGCGWTARERASEDEWVGRSFGTG